MGTMFRLVGDLFDFPHRLISPLLRLVVALPSFLRLVRAVGVFALIAVTLLLRFVIAHL